MICEENRHPSQQVEKQPDDSILSRLHLAVTPDFIDWLLYYGSRVEVLEPASLGEELAAEQRRAAEANSVPKPGLCPCGHLIPSLNFSSLC
ncbi:MAG: WYL domain-containing protein [Bacillota bacterium]